MLKMNVVFFNVDLHEKQFTQLINDAIETCHSHVQPKVLHFAKLYFWRSYSKFEREQNLVQCKKLRLDLLSTCKLFFPFVSFLILVCHLNFWIMGVVKMIWNLNLTSR
jgi:hypothetical protein